MAAAPEALGDLPEPEPMPVEAEAEEVSAELETTPPSPPVEPPEFVEPAIVSEPVIPLPVEVPPEPELLTPRPLVAADIEAEAAHIAMPMEGAPAFQEVREPQPDVDEPLTLSELAVQVEPTAPVVPERSGAPEPTPVVPRVPVEPPLPLLPPAVSPPPKFVELADYWRSLRSGDEHPAAESIDRDFVTERWPGSLLITYTPASQDPQGEPRPGRVTRLGTACAETQNAVDAGSHSTEWMLEVARTALITDEPLEEQQRLSTLTGDAGFRMVALPLGPPQGLANAVLCALLPSLGAPRFGKRRTWL